MKMDYLVNNLDWKIKQYLKHVYLKIAAQKTRAVRLFRCYARCLKLHVIFVSEEFFYFWVMVNGQHDVLSLKLN